MNSSWREYILDQVIECFIDYRGKTPRKTSSGIPLITAKIVKNGKILEPTEFIAEEDYISWMRRGLPKLNDVVLTTEAPLGEVAILKNENVALAQRIIIMRGIKNILDNKFLKYFFQSKYGQEELHIRSSGTTVTGIKSSELKKISLFCPCYKEQKNIAAVLGSLDDKIDLLQRQNATLEAMAETLFRQWFIEEAQEGWEEKTIGDVVEIRGGGTPSTKEPSYWNGNIFWTSPRDLAGLKSIFLSSTERKITSQGLSKISSGLLPAGTLLLSSRAPIGYLAIAGIDVAINQGYIAILNNNIISNYYMYLWCKYYMEEIKAASNGSVFQEISKSVFKTLPFILPPEVILKEFYKKIDPIFKKINANQNQIRTLEKLRDTLLPKLMSGEVRVRVDG